VQPAPNLNHKLRVRRRDGPPRAQINRRPLTWPVLVPVVEQQKPFGARRRRLLPRFRCQILSLPTLVHLPSTTCRFSPFFKLGVLFSPSLETEGALRGLADALTEKLGEAWNNNDAAAVARSSRRTRFS
jgi:hypothetical protein